MFGWFCGIISVRAKIQFLKADSYGLMQDACSCVRQLHKMSEWNFCSAQPFYFIASLYLISHFGKFVATIEHVCILHIYIHNHYYHLLAQFFTKMGNIFYNCSFLRTFTYIISVYMHKYLNE